MRNAANRAPEKNNRAARKEELQAEAKQRQEEYDKLSVSEKIIRAANSPGDSVKQMKRLHAEQMAASAKRPKFSAEEKKRSKKNK